MPPESSCGIGVGALDRLGHADPLEHLDRRASRASFVEAVVLDQHLGELGADLEARVERGHRVLEDHRDVAAAIDVELVGREREEVDVAEHRPAGRPAVVGEKAHDREEGLALARTGFADDGERLARPAA